MGDPVRFAIDVLIIKLDVQPLVYNRHLIELQNITTGVTSDVHCKKIGSGIQNIGKITHQK